MFLADQLLVTRMQLFLGCACSLLVALAMFVASYAWALLILIMLCLRSLRAGKGAHANAYEFVCCRDANPTLAPVRPPMLAVVFMQLLPRLRMLLCVPRMDRSMSLLLIVIVILLLPLHQYLLLRMVVHQF